MRTKNREIISISIIITLIILGSAVTLYAGEPDEPHTAKSMWIEPSSINLSTDTHSIGYKFNVTVWVNVTGYEGTIGGWQFKLIYDTAYLNVTGCDYTADGKSQFFENITTMGVLPSFGSYNGTGPGDEWDYVQHGESWLSGPARGPGYGSLSWVEFEIMAEPDPGQEITAVLDISTAYHPPSSDTYVLDWDTLEEIPLNVYNCNYRFTSAEAPGLSVSIAPLSVVMDVGQSQLFTSSVSGGTPPYAYQWYLDEAPVSGATGSTWTFTPTSSGSYTVHLNVTDNVGVTEKSNTVPVTVNPPPPVAGTRLYVDPPEIIDPTMLPSSTFSINITVENVTNLVTCQFNLTYNPDIVGWMSITVLKVQNQTPTPKINIDDEAGFIWVKLTYPAPVTTYTPLPLVTITFYVDALGATPLNLKETQLLDDEEKSIEHEAQDGYFCTLIRDVAIINITVPQTWIYQGWSIDITVTVKNEGMINETFAVTTYYNNQIIGNLTVENLPPSNETTITFTWNTENVTPCVNYTISAHASIVPYEIDTADNQYVNGQIKVRIIGDLNGDGKVDIIDILETAKAFGSFPGHERWNPNADFNKDNKVGIIDIFIVAKNYGKSCPP